MVGSFRGFSTRFRGQEEADRSPSRITSTLRMPHQRGSVLHSRLQEALVFEIREDG